MIVTSAILVLKVMERSFFNQGKMYCKCEVLLRPLNADGFSKQETKKGFHLKVMSALAPSKEQT